MGLLKLFDKSKPALMRLPSGSFTTDSRGAVLIDTLPSSFPRSLLSEIAQQVLAAFREAAAAQLPLAELNIRYASLRITACELRGGALIFLTPQGLTQERPPVPGRMAAAASVKE
jgi:hypothetical protein